MKSIQFELGATLGAFNLAGEVAPDPWRIEREKEAERKRQAEREAYERKHQQDLMRCSLAQIREAFPAAGAYELCYGAVNGYIHKGQFLTVRHEPTQEIIARAFCVETTDARDESAAVWEWVS